MFLETTDHLYKRFLYFQRGANRTEKKKQAPAILPFLWRSHGETIWKAWRVLGMQPVPRL